MVDFTRIDAPVSITKEFIYSRLSDEMIFFHYFGSFSLGKSYCSKLRKDNNPSTSFFINDTGKIVYHDYALGKNWDAIGFVMEMFRLSFGDALKKIAHDFGITKDASLGNVMSYKDQNKALSFDKKLKKEKEFQFVLKDWDQNSLDYWRRYKFTDEEITSDKHLYTIDELFINKKRIYNPSNNLWFLYVIRDIQYPFDPSKVFFKTYMPEGNEDLKWFTNNPNSNPYGYLDLPYKSDTLIITKSRKDMKVVRKLWPDTMATQNESEGALPVPLIKTLKLRYPKIYIWFDADNTGVQNCTKFNKYGLGYINTPKDLLHIKVKDPSDYVERYDYDNLQDFMQTKLKLWT